MFSNYLKSYFNIFFLLLSLFSCFNYLFSWPISSIYLNPYENLEDGVSDYDLNPENMLIRKTRSNNLQPDISVNILLLF